MAEVTRQEFLELRAMVEETYYMARGALKSIVGKEASDDFASRVSWHCDPENRRWRSERALYKVGLSEQNMRPLTALADAGIETLDDAARLRRDAVAAIPGVGDGTLERLDAALAEHGMTWAEVA